MKFRPTIALTALSCALLVFAAPAGAKLRILAPQQAQATQPIHFAAAPSRPTERIAFYVDGSRRWVDRSPGWKFGHDGYLSLRPGRHVLKVRAVQPARIVTTTRPIYVEPETTTELSPREVGRTDETEPAEEAEAPAGEAAPEEEAAQTEEPALPEESEPEHPHSNGPAPMLDAGFENGFSNWNVAGVGETLPTIESSDVRSGSQAALVRLTGSQNRSELSLGGTGNDNDGGMVHFKDGDEYWYGFSFNIQQMVWGRPGAHNLIMQFKSEGTGSPEFGLHLWNYAGDDGHSGGRGLWSHSNAGPDAPGGDRFLAPLSEDEWHDVAIHFKDSDSHDGFYEIYLDGELVEAHSNVTMIVPGRSFAYIKNGLYRNGGTIPGTSEVLFDAARLGTTAASVAPH